MTILAGVTAAIETLGYTAHVGRALDGTPLPCVTVDPPTAMTPEYDTGTSFGEEQTVRVHVWATDVDEAERIASTIEAELVVNGITASGGTVCDVRREGRETFLDPDREESGDEVWHSVADYVVTVSREPGA